MSSIAVNWNCCLLALGHFLVDSEFAALLQHLASGVVRIVVDAVAAAAAVVVETQNYLEARSLVA